MDVKIGIFETCEFFFPNPESNSKLNFEANPNLSTNPTRQTLNVSETQAQLFHLSLFLHVLIGMVS